MKLVSYDSCSILFLCSILSAYENILTPSFARDTSPKPFRTDLALSSHFKKDNSKVIKSDL